MPNYDYKCGVCGKEKEAFRKISDRNNVTCCDIKMSIIMKSSLKPICYGHGYYCMGMGEYVTGPGHRRRLMNEKNLVEVG